MRLGLGSPASSLDTNLVYKFGFTLQLLEETAKHINDYALIGLRTLAVAKRDLTEEDYHRHALLWFSVLKPKL